MHRTLAPFAEVEPALLLVFCTNLAWRRSFLSAQQRTAAHSSANNTHVADNTYVGEFHDILAQPPPLARGLVRDWLKKEKKTMFIKFLSFALLQAVR